MFFKIKLFAQKLAKFQNNLLLSLFYILFILPIALILKLFSDPLMIKKKGGFSFWQDRKIKDENLEEVKRQY